MSRITTNAISKSSNDPVQSATTIILIHTIFRRTSIRNGGVLRWDRGRPRRTNGNGPRRNCGPARALSDFRPARTREPRKPVRTSEPPERYCSVNERQESIIKFSFIKKILISNIDCTRIFVTVVAPLPTQSRV